MAKKIQPKGFTLIEILVVIGIIAILAAVVIIAINPARQFAQARNSQRQANIESILNAIGQNLADHKGISTCTVITTSTSTIGTGGSPFIDLSTCLANYLPAGIPTDPTATSGADTKYKVVVDSLGRYQVCANANETALGADNPVNICVTR
jgi:prepilin-type N-terminal cleavage/methylation domain-containing protein